MTTPDPLRAKLDEIAAEKHRRDALLDKAYPRGPGGQAIFPDETEWPYDALRAVLELMDLCNDAQHGYAVPVDYLRIAISGALGLTEREL